MKNSELLGLSLLIFLGCIMPGCRPIDTATISSPSQETTGLELSTSISPSLSSSTLSAAEISIITPVMPTLSDSTFTPVPATAVATAMGSDINSTPTLPPFLPGYLVFSVWGTPPHGIALINTDGSSRRWVTYDYPVSEIGIYDEPTWSPDGHWVAFTLGFMDEGDDEIYMINVNGSDMQQITYDDLGSNFLAWSPNGQEIAFTAPELTILNLSNGGARRIGESLQDTSGLAWSPDGRQIAVRAAIEDGGYFLYLIDASGENLSQITDFEVGSGRISWSPDGQQIAYRSAEGCGDICILELEDGTHRCLTSTAGAERDPAWSPDGRFIAFLATQEYTLCWDQVTGEPIIPGWQVSIMDVDGLGITTITDNTEIYYGLAWSPVPSLQIGGSYTISEWGDKLSLREAPSLSGAFITQLLQGDLVTILEGPVDAEDYYWWRLRTEDGIEGWAVEVYRWYQPVGE